MGSQKGRPGARHFIQKQGKRRSEKLLMGDLKIASVSAPPLGRGDVTAADAGRKHSSAPSSPTTATAVSSSNGIVNGSPAVRPLVVATTITATTSEANELLAEDATATDSVAGTNRIETATTPHDGAPDGAAGGARNNDEDEEADEPLVGDASAVDVTVAETTASDDSDAAVTDENESVSADEPPTQATDEDPVELVDTERGAIEKNGELEEKTPQSEVHRKRKRSKRLGFSGSRPKQRRQNACPPLRVQLPDSRAVPENGHGDAPESPIFGESSVLYPSTPSEGAWDWSMSDVYYDPLTQENLDQLVRARKSCANIVAANLDACKGMRPANTETAHLTMMMKDANDAISARVRPLRRGRRYRDVWEEEDFLSLERKRDGLSVDKKRAFSDQDVLLSNHELVHGYDDELFERYISQLEAQVGQPQQSTDASKALPSSSGGGGGVAQKSDNKGGDAKREPVRKGAGKQKQKLKQSSSPTDSVMPPIPLHQCHPAAWGNWIIKKQTTCFDIIHPASLCRKMVPRRWKEESEVLEQFTKSQQEKDEANGDVDDEDEAEFDTTRPLAEQRAVPVATALWGNGKDDITKLRSFGTVVEEDEISREISASLTKLIPLSMYNWRLAQTVYERAATYAQCSSALQQEADLVKRVEELYQRLYPARVANDAEPDDADAPDRRIPVFHSRHADVIAHSLKFCRDNEESHCVAASVEYALTLQVGDEVDVLDRNGCWNDGVVVEVFCENGCIVKYVLLRLSLWDASAVEWVSVTEGRILPRGVADGKMVFAAGPTRFQKRRIEFNRVLADTLEKTFSVRHVEQNAAAAARKSELAAAHSDRVEDAKLQKKKAKRAA